MKYIIARNDEDVSWSKDLDSFIVQKGEHLENKGREPSSYLWYIIQNYDKLSGHYTFVQGNPFDHARDILTQVTEKDFKWYGDKEYTTDQHGRPTDTCEVKDLAPEGTVYPVKFLAGCQFTVSAERIKRYQLRFYKELYNKLLKEEQRSPWAFERIIGELFGDR